MVVFLRFEKGWAALLEFCMFLFSIFANFIGKALQRRIFYVIDFANEFLYVLQSFEL